MSSLKNATTTVQPPAPSDAPPSMVASSTHGTSSSVAEPGPMSTAQLVVTSGALLGPSSGTLPGPMTSTIPGPMSSTLPGPTSDILPSPISDVRQQASLSAPETSVGPLTAQEMFGEGAEDISEMSVTSPSSNADDELEESEPSLNELVEKGKELRAKLVSALNELDSWTSLVQHYKKSKKTKSE